MPIVVGGGVQEQIDGADGGLSTRPEPLPTKPGTDKHL